ncbi:Y-family DNA polymerase [Novosphingobium mangrovi (ex Huang et al. 2023)]|uniref:DNA-directed DNA polymerase n=1 Tax=Novosphingobium mangrovi (ex Huang et al. 2023) TaxID=2976432 RepID=A0ABT2I2J0_9SPHN|nr:DNA polymerase Y family protein [Novosphingobium mangrovi (ex Huang et al. 2023)]MCT2399019.1 DNA polymerase Y family protein [Novosphingobium mangrovi (ex Huang et al. 2023)]
MDARAGRMGLTVGMTLADARARCPDLKSLPHDYEADARELERLTARMLHFTPMAAVDPPDGIMLDITACAHLFGGEAALAHAVMEQAGYTARHAFAAHAAAARALARYGNGETIHRAPSSSSLRGRRPKQSRAVCAGSGLPRGFAARNDEGKGDGGGGGEEEHIRALPIAALELPEDAQSGLRRAGLFTLSDLAARPMAALAARFGGETVARLRAVLGEQDSPMAPQRPSARLRAEARFAEPVARTDYVLEVIEDLLADLSRQMEARHLGGRCFTVRLERTDGARRRLTVETSLPSRDPARIARLFRERIEGLADPLDPGFGFDAIALAAGRTEPLHPAQPEIGGKVAEAESIAVLIDRLTTRFGEHGVLRPVPCDTHIPEAAQQVLPAMHAAPARWPDVGERLPRPLFLLDPPQPVTALASVPDGPPQRLRWRGQVHEIVRAEGPERIAPEWWHRPQGHVPGGAGLTRDYYRIEDAQGSRYWVFRHGLYGETGEPRWYVHGLFA